MSREVSSGYYIQINFSNITATLYQSIKPRASTQRVTSIQFTSQLESGPRASLRGPSKRHQPGAVGELAVTRQRLAGRRRQVDEAAIRRN